MLYPVLVDLGSPACLALSEEILDRIQEKIPCQGRVFTAIDGKAYSLEGYTVSGVRFRNLAVKDLEVLSGKRSFFEEVGRLKRFSENKKAHECVGKVGFGFFSLLKMPLFLDMQHNMLYIRASFQRLKQEGYRIKQWTKVPFAPSSSFGIVFEVETDLGSKRLALDTGATLSLLSYEAVGGKEGETGELYHSQKCKIGKSDFGEHDFFLTRFPEAFHEIDGMLGMNFLKEHVVYLDIPKKVAYIAKAKDCRKGPFPEYPARKNVF